MATRPSLGEGDARRLLETHWALHDVVLRALDSSDDQNWQVNVPDGTRYVLKVLHAEASDEQVAMESAAMRVLRDAGIVAPLCVATVDDGGGGGGAQWVRAGCNIVRLLTWIDGVDYERVPLDRRLELAPAVGQLVAQLDVALARIQPVPAAAERHWPWRTSDAALMHAHRAVIVRRQPAARVALWDATLAQWDTHWRAAAAALPHGLVHNDVNDNNLLVHMDARGAISVRGVIDLGDMTREAYALALGNTLYYAMLGQPASTLAQHARHLLRGYEAVRPLSAAERHGVAVGARMRCLVSVTMAGVACERDPATAYAHKTEQPGWLLLEQLAALGEHYTAPH